MKWGLDGDFEKPGQRWLMYYGEHLIGAVVKVNSKHLVRAGYGAQVFAPLLPMRQPPIIYGGLLAPSLTVAQQWCERAAQIDIVPRLQLLEILELE